MSEAINAVSTQCPEEYADTVGVTMILFGCNFHLHPLGLLHPEDFTLEELAAGLQDTVDKLPKKSIASIKKTVGYFPKNRSGEPGVRVIIDDHAFDESGSVRHEDGYWKLRMPDDLSEESLLGVWADFIIESNFPAFLLRGFMRDCIVSRRVEDLKQILEDIKMLLPD